MCLARLIIRRFREHLSCPMPAHVSWAVPAGALPFKIGWITYTYFPLGPWPLESLDLGRDQIRPSLTPVTPGVPPTSSQQIHFHSTSLAKPGRASNSDTQTERNLLETESPRPFTLQALSLVEKAEPVRVRTSHYDAWGTNGVCPCKMDREVYMDSYMASSNGSCFMVTWSGFKNLLLKVGLTQNHRETVTLWTLTTVGLFCFLMCEDPRE